MTSNFNNLSVRQCHYRVHKCKSIRVGSFNEKKKKTLATKQNLDLNKYKKAWYTVFRGATRHEHVTQNEHQSSGGWTTNQFEGVSGEFSHP